MCVCVCVCVCACGCMGMQVCVFWVCLGINIMIHIKITHNNKTI